MERCLGARLCPQDQSQQGDKVGGVELSDAWVNFDVLRLGLPQPRPSRMPTTLRRRNVIAARCRDDEQPGNALRGDNSFNPQAHPRNRRVLLSKLRLTFLLPAFSAHS